MVSLERDANQLGVGICLRGCGGMATVVRDSVIRVRSRHDGAWGRGVVAVGCGFLYFSRLLMEHHYTSSRSITKPQQSRNCEF